MVVRMNVLSLWCQEGIFHMEVLLLSLERINENRESAFHVSTFFFRKPSSKYLYFKMLTSVWFIYTLTLVPYFFLSLRDRASYLLPLLPAVSLWSIVVHIFDYNQHLHMLAGLSPLFSLKLEYKMSCLILTTDLKDKSEQVSLSPGFQLGTFKF